MGRALGRRAGTLAATVPRLAKRLRRLGEFRLLLFLDRLLADEPLAHRLSQAGRKDVESRFRAEGMVEALSAIYGES